MQDNKRDLEELGAKAMHYFDALSLAKQKEQLKAQKASWVRGELGIGLDVDKAEARKEHLARQVQDFTLPPEPPPTDKLLAFIVVGAAFAAGFITGLLLVLL